MAIWTPEYIDSAVWLDAADNSTTVLDQNGGISQWEDKSGNGRHATQGSSGNRPVLQQALLNGCDALRFDGTDDFLTLGTALGKPASYSVFVVGRITKALSNTQALCGSINSAGQSATAWGSVTNLASQAGKHWWQYGTGSAYRWGFGEGAFTQNSWGVHAILHAHGTQNETPYLNGSSLTSTGLDGTATSVSGTAYAFSIGRSGESAAYLGGEIAEIIIALTAVTLEDRQKIEGYLAHKWGLAASLPSGHPYKSAAPFIGAISGIITDRFGNPCQRKVYAVSRPTDATSPVVLAHGLSDATTGAYELIIPSAGEVTRIVVSEDDDPLLNDLVDRVIPA
jgi:hypothetical protein